MTTQQQTDLSRALAASIAAQARVRRENAAHDRLIACAPELLATLKSAVAYADAMHRAQVWEEHEKHVDYVTFPEWRAVIAKAEGAEKTQEGNP